MKFSYLKFPLPQRSPIFGDSILKPIVPIQLSVGDSTLRYAAPIDSGADFCILDGSVDEYLGPSIRSGVHEIFGGIQDSGGAEAFLHKITINVGGWDYLATVARAASLMECGFIMFVP